ncbi:MAG TPA: ATP-binding protein [Candidatus Gallacutalibacter stercoravium]|nr:ATP-binding protein [Candidatus Gallacutalibacter stercoravium]
MSYSKAVYEAATNILTQRRREAQAGAEQRRRDLYARFPRAEEIERELSSTAVRAARSVLNHGNVAQELRQLKESNLALQRELAGLLQSANLPQDYLEPHFACAACKDTGYIDGRMCACLRQLLRNEAYRRLNALSPLSLSTFDNFSLEYYDTAPLREGAASPRRRMEDILGYCQRYAQSFSPASPNLLLQGATGLGKTHLSLAIANAAIEKGFGVVYGSTQNIVSKLEKERFGRGAEEDEDSEAHLISCDLLILDDLGTEFTTSFSTAAVYNCINSRIMAGRPTIISTNLSMRELEKSYSERFVSRIMGHYVRLEFLGRDVRQRRRGW